MARMVLPLVEEQGDPEMLACVGARKDAYIDTCSVAEKGGGVGAGGKVGGDAAAEKEPLSDVLLEWGTHFSGESSTETATSIPSSSLPSSSSNEEPGGGVCNSTSFPPGHTAEEAATYKETSALLPPRLLRPRTKKASLTAAEEEEVDGMYGGVGGMGLAGIGAVGGVGVPTVAGDSCICEPHRGGSGRFSATNMLSCLIAMLQGVEVLCNLAILYLYKDDFLLAPAVLAVAMGALKVPWTIKPVWALMSDNLPLFGYRRKSYIFIGSALCIFALLSLGLFGYQNLWATTVLLFLYFAGSAMCNVIGEALVVEQGRKASSEEGAANSVSVFFAFRKISFAIMSYLSGFLLTYMDKRFVFVLGTVLPLAVFITNFFLTETRAIVLPLREQFERLFDIMKRPVVLNSTLFIFLMMSTPSAGSIMFYYMTNELKFGPELLGRMALFQSVASLFGILTYWWLFRRTNLRKLLLFSTLVVTPFCMLPVVLVQRWNVKMGIPDTAFVVTDTVLLEFVGELQTMPVLVLGARLCPPGLESSIYSFLLSAYNFGLGFGSLLSAGMTAAYGISSTNFTNLTPMIIVCALTNLLPLGVLWLVPDSPSCLSDELERDREPTSAFSSDTETGTSQLSTRSASEVEKGAAAAGGGGGSSRRGRSRCFSSSDSSDSDVYKAGSITRRYDWQAGDVPVDPTHINTNTTTPTTTTVAAPFESDSVSYTANGDPNTTTTTAASTSYGAHTSQYVVHNNSIPPAAAPAAVAAAQAAQEAAAAAAGGPPGSMAAALRSRSSSHTRGGLTAAVGAAAAAAGPAAPSAYSSPAAAGITAAHTSSAAPAAVDVMAAAMESGGSGECIGAIPSSNVESSR